jgi:hypothetical protein
MPLCVVDASAPVPCSALFRFVGASPPAPPPSAANLVASFFLVLRTIPRVAHGRVRRRREEEGVCVQDTKRKEPRGGGRAAGKKPKREEVDAAAAAVQQRTAHTRGGQPQRTAHIRHTIRAQRLGKNACLPPSCSLERPQGAMAARFLATAAAKSTRRAVEWSPSYRPQHAPPMHARPIHDICRLFAHGGGSSEALRASSSSQAGAARPAP